jgi:hypothetical protein
VAVSSSTVIPAQANITYSNVAPAVVFGSGTGGLFNISRSATGAVVSVARIDAGSGFAPSELILISGSDVGGTSGTDDILLNVSAVADSTVEVFLEFLDSSFFPTAESIIVDLTGQAPGVVPFSLSATCPAAGLNLVQVGFRNRGIEGTAGEIRISNLSVTAANP